MQSNKTAGKGLGSRSTGPLIPTLNKAEVAGDRKKQNSVLAVVVLDST